MGQRTFSRRMTSAPIIRMASGGTEYRRDLASLVNRFLARSFSGPTQKKRNDADDLSTLRTTCKLRQAIHLKGPLFLSKEWGVPPPPRLSLSVLREKRAADRSSCTQTPLSGQH